MQLSKIPPLFFRPTFSRVKITDEKLCDVFFPVVSKYTLPETNSKRTSQESGYFQKDIFR